MTRPRKPRATRAAVTAGLALAVSLALAACSSSSGATAAPGASTGASAGASAAAASTCAVSTSAAGTPAQIKSFAFPTGLTVKAGDAIAWSNGDAVGHTVTFDDGTCASGTIAPGSTVTISYTVPGSYPFHCSIHASMKGTLVVTG